MRMFGAVLLLGLCACTQQHTQTTPVLSALSDYGCPKLAEDSGYSVKAVLGPDYTICELTPKNPTLFPAELFIDGHWTLPNNSHFSGFSNTPIGHIAWFYGTDPDQSLSQLIAFIPTGLDRPDMAMLVIRDDSLQKAHAKKETLLMAIIRAGMIPGNLIKPKRPPQ